MASGPLRVVARVASATLEEDKKCKIQRSSSADYSESWVHVFCQYRAVPR